jgi:hypothetical protein
MSKIKVGGSVLITEKLNEYIENYGWCKSMKEFIGNVYEVKKIVDSEIYIDNGDKESNWFVIEDCCEVVDLEIKGDSTYKYLCKVTYLHPDYGNLKRYIVCDNMQQIEEFVLEKEVGDLINIEVISYSPDTFEDKVVILGG